jgi:KaiC/GvpD/RAD55 family RecA-like ATPase
MSSAGDSSNKTSPEGGEGVPLDTTEGQIIVLIMPEENYIERLMVVVGDAEDFGGKICYVSLNRPYDSLMKIFQKCGVSEQNFHFIDAITSTAKVPVDCEKCDFVSSPGALTELSVAIAKAMEKEKYSCLLFDSLSTLLVYESDTTIAKFVHFLMAKVRVVGCSAIFTCLKQDSDSILVKDINMFADKVIDIEKWHLKS